MANTLPQRQGNAKISLMNWLSENYKWLFDGVAGAAALSLIGYFIHRFTKSKGQNGNAALNAQGAKVTNSPVASGSNITQTVNSPTTINLALGEPTIAPRSPGRRLRSDSAVFHSRNKATLES